VILRRPGWYHGHWCSRGPSRTLGFH